MGLSLLFAPRPGEPSPGPVGRLPPLVAVTPRAATAAGQERRAPWPPELSECVCARARPLAAGSRTRGPFVLGRPNPAWPWVRLRGGDQERGRQRRRGQEGAE